VPSIPTRSLRIAWLGAGPGEGGGVPGVATDLLDGLTALGHRVDCFLPSAEYEPPSRLAANENLTFIWGTSDWRWDRWYSRTRFGAFASGLLARALASLRLRREIERRHAREPYDLLYQFSNIESLAVPARVGRAVPLVIHPETHVAGELRWLLAERRLALRCQSRRMFATVVSIMLLRALVQRVRIRRADLLVCISGVFRDHLVHDYGFPRQATVVVPNPVRAERFAAGDRPLGAPPTVLVLGRIAVRKGIADVVCVARTLHERELDARIRVVGGPSLWSDFTPLLEDLPPEQAEYAGGVPAPEIPQELAGADILLQASRYEPFALTVAEALAAGLPVVATSEVGAIEGVDCAVVAEVAPGDVEGMARAIERMLEQLRTTPVQTRSTARAEARRLFAPEVVCGQISDALERLVDPPGDDAPPGPSPPIAPPTNPPPDVALRDPDPPATAPSATTPSAGVARPQRARVPDFFIVGHPKSGTTALYDALLRHPQIFMPANKEPWFFSSELAPREPPRPSGTGWTPQTLEEYLALFDDAGADQRAGEASVPYLWSRTAAQRIAEVRPQARIVAILREPASFLRSLHLQFVQTYIETEKDLRKALSLEQSRREGRNVPRNSYWPGATLYSDHVRYVEQLRRYHEAFPAEQVLVLIYDDFRHDNEAVLRAVLRHLEVDDTAPVSVRQVNPTVNVRARRLHELTHALATGRGPLARATRASATALAPRRLNHKSAIAIRNRLFFTAPPPADEDLMRELRRRYKPEVQTLSDYLGRDLVRLWGYDELG
jgi:glycosyltransferase involved in cell wall biosynthesis